VSASSATLLLRVDLHFEENSKKSFWRRLRRRQKVRTSVL
jgi:hypothetical protein